MGVVNKWKQRHRKVEIVFIQQKFWKFLLDDKNTTYLSSKTISTLNDIDFNKSGSK